MRKFLTGGIFTSLASLFAFLSLHHATFLLQIVRAQDKLTLSPITKSFIATDAPVIALQHVRVIDGTGAAPLADQTVLIENGAIREIGANVSIPSDAHSMDLTGRTVIPGLVGMHDHMFYPAPSGQGAPIPGAPPLYGEMGFSFPRLYLAGGVTSLRTTGSLEPYADLALKKLIDSGRIPGPKAAHHWPVSRRRRYVRTTAPRIEGR